MIEPLRSKYGENHLLIADAERNAAVSRLEQAVGRGLLELDEFTARVDVVFASRTRGEFSAATADLRTLIPDYPETGHIH